MLTTTRLAFTCPLLLFVLAASGCISLRHGCVSNPAPKSKPSPKPNTTWTAPILALQNFAAEEKYVRDRRQQADLPPRSRGKGIALAMSGGGERSATVNLGVLQGLEEKGLLRNVDYISSVSGGSYTAAWYVAHLLPSGQQPVASTGGAFAYQSDRGSLLQVADTGRLEERPGASPGAVDELREESGFVFGRHNWRLPFQVIPAWMATQPFNATFDLAAHFKPVRGKFNTYHPNYFYDRAIRRTYLKPPQKSLSTQDSCQSGFWSKKIAKNKTHGVTLSEINETGSQAPYLIINATLANAAPKETLRDIKNSFFASNVLPFEFSRHNCGAPFLGYLSAENFGFPVVGVQQTATGRDAILRPNSVPFLKNITKPMLLSSAVSASGAALDASLGGKVNESALKNNISNSYGGTDVPVPVITTRRLLWDAVLKPLNLNLRYQNRNFHMRPHTAEDGIWTLADDIADRGREITKDRFRPTIKSNCLYLSDGAHVDNLGIYALSIRPDVNEIWSIDATQDKKYEFSDLQKAVQILKTTGWKVNWDNGLCPIAKPADTKRTKQAFVWSDTQTPVFHATCHREGRTLSLWYVKLSYRLNDGDALPFTTKGNQAYGGGLKKWLNDFHKSHRTFPHTSTFNLSFSEDDFTAYREIGRIMAHHFANDKLKK
jgi:Patatin-like phospholipase